MTEFTDHQLEKKENIWHCQVCGQTFKRKPKIAHCPGVKIRDLGKNELYNFQLHSLNLKLKPNVLPIAYGKQFQHRLSQLDSKYFIYKIKQTTVIEPSLPTAYLKTEIPECLISSYELRKRKMQPKRGIKPVACAQFSSEIKGDWEYYWEMYYHKDDCEPGEGMQYITKTRLKENYHLSEGWVKRLGTPDLILANPHIRKAAPMQLFIIGKVEEFIRENAAEYAEWLIKREKMAIRSEPLQRYQENQNRYKQQNRLCLKCACSAAYELGLICAVHPISFPPGVPLEEFCPDFVE